MNHLNQSPKDPGFVQNPYPFYDRARADGPFFFWNDYNMVCTGSATVTNAIFRDRRFGREVPPEIAQPIPPHLAPFYAVEAHSMLELEPPRHTRLRGLVLRAFTSRRIAALAPEISQLTHDLIDRLPAGEFDLLTHFGQPLPVTIIARLLGVPEAMGPDLLRWSNAMVGMYQAGRTPAMEAAAETAASSDEAIPCPRWARARLSRKRVARLCQGCSSRRTIRSPTRAELRQWTRRRSSPWRYSRTVTSSALPAAKARGRLSPVPVQAPPSGTWGSGTVRGTTVIGTVVRKERPSSTMPKGSLTRTDIGPIWKCPRTSERIW